MSILLVTPRLLWKQGTNLNKYKYSFNKLQQELGVSYDPGRDDQQILALTALMHLAPVRQGLQQELSTPAPTNLEPEAEPSRPQKSRQWAEIYAALSLGIEDLLPYDRDSEIAQRAFKLGAESESVEEIIAQSPVNWTRDEASLIASLAKVHLEQEHSQSQHRAAIHQAQALPSPTPVQAPLGYLEKEENQAQSTQKRSPDDLPQITAAQLLAAERSIASYFTAAPTNPTDQQLAIATERYREKLATAATANQEYRRSEQERESASIVDLLRPGYREKRKEAAKLAARFIGAAKELERTQSELNKLEQQRSTFYQWQTSPQTMEMEVLRDYLNTQEAKTRLREIKVQQREHSPTETRTGAGTGIPLIVRSKLSSVPQALPLGIPRGTKWQRLVMG